MQSKYKQWTTHKSQAHSEFSWIENTELQKIVTVIKNPKAKTF